MVTQARDVTLLVFRNAARETLDIDELHGVNLRDLGHS